MSNQRIPLSKQSTILVQPLPFYKKYFIPTLIAKLEDNPLYKRGEGVGTMRCHHFTDVCQKSQSYDVCFLRYEV